jgi:hypothetical protein
MAGKTKGREARDIGANIGPNVPDNQIQFPDRRQIIPCFIGALRGAGRGKPSVFSRIEVLAGHLQDRIL